MATAQGDRAGICVYCGVTGPVQDEHVFPAAWYPSTTPAGQAKAKVPACAACNTRFSQLEQRFIRWAALAVEHDDEAARGVFPAVIRSRQWQTGKTEAEQRHRARTFAAVWSAIRFVLPEPGSGGARVLVRTPAGLLVEAAPAASLSGEDLGAMVRKLVRGFHPIYAGESLPLDAEIMLLRLDRMDPADAAAGYEQIPTDARYGPGLLIKRFTEGGPMTFWAFLLWGQIRLGAIVNPDYAQLDAATAGEPSS